jgi:hypothetical protein
VTNKMVVLAGLAVVLVVKALLLAALELLVKAMLVVVPLVQASLTMVAVAVAVLVRLAQMVIHQLT